MRRHQREQIRACGLRERRSREHGASARFPEGRSASATGGVGI
jgi:hypothetical protein